MRLNRRIVLTIIILVISLSFSNISKASDISLQEVLPGEVNTQFEDITTTEETQSVNIYNEYNETVDDEKELTNTNTLSMSQYEIGRMNSKVPTVDASLKIYDYADLFSENEEKQLYDAVTAFIEKNNMDMAIVTIKYNPERQAMVYADDFYDYNEFGKNASNDGVLFLIDMDTREMWISTTGDAINRLNDREIDRILDKCYNKITAKEYFECANEFIKHTDILIKSTGSQTTFSPAFNPEQILIGAAGGAIVGMIYYAMGSSKHRLIRRENRARNYESKLNLTTNTDILVHHTVNRVYSPQTTSSGSGGFGGGGGSSIHIGSSGISHGGGGRHF